MQNILGLVKRILRKILNGLKKLLFNLQQIYFQVVGSKVECNICHYKADKFISDSWHSYCICPICWSGVHHRLIMASLTSLSNFSFDNIIKNKNVLHFAPEKLLGEIIKKRAKEYKTADFFTEGYSYQNIDYNIDISDMKPALRGFQPHSLILLLKAT